jgi:hypothetical protein
MIYDAAGNLLSETSAQSTTVSYDNHQTTSYGYDALNRENQVIQGYGTVIATTGTMIYDNAGNLLSETNGISSTATYDHHTTTSFGYDALNRETTQIDGYGVTGVQRTVTTVFDAAAGWHDPEHGCEGRAEVAETSLPCRRNQRLIDRLHRHRPNSPCGPWLQMQKLAHSTSLAFKGAQSRCVPSLTLCHSDPKKWHTLSPWDRKVRPVNVR